MLTFNDYCKQTFGDKVYKIALKGGDSCPNRQNGGRGCTFCAEGSGDFAEYEGSVTEQIERAKKRVESKCKSGKYIAYFQTYTATYCLTNERIQGFFEGANHPDIVAVSIATRPDCIDERVLNLFCELQKIKPLFVELGLQTIHDDSAKAFHRGYPTSLYFEVVEQLKARKIHVVTHVILGLPNESRQQILQTVQAVGKVTDGIKLQLLHILKGTPLAEQYARGEVPVFTLEEYVELVKDCLAVLPQEVVVHRLTGDAPKKLLIAPLWSADKKRVLNHLHKVCGMI